MSSGRGESAISVAIVALFLVVRLALLVVREPFFDELFTVWMAGRPLADVLPALRLDSGPPLYYFLARLDDVFALRAVSLVFSTATLVLILSRRSLGQGRLVAAALLALYPPAALAAADARSYALCGLLIAIGAICIHEQRPFSGATAILFAASTHYYGALFFPFVLLTRPRSRSVIAFLLAALLYLPCLWLAWEQPPEAMTWLAGQQSPLAALGTLAFAGRYAEALFAPAPMAIVVLSLAAVLVAGSRRWTFAPMVLGPVLMAVLFAFAGRTVYFPMRFESVIAVPLVLWLSTSLEAWRPAVRRVLVVVLAGCGFLSLLTGILDHWQRPSHPYRVAAAALRQLARPGEPILASGYLYLEAVHQLGEGRVTPFPAEQGRHPGWRVAGVRREPVPQGAFLWIGERAAPEQAAIAGRRAQVLVENGEVLMLRVQESLSTLDR